MQLPELLRHRSLPRVAAASVLALCSFAGAPGLSAGDASKCAPTARLSKISDKHVYEISATTDLPDDTVCTLAVLYLKHLPPIPNLPPEESREFELEEIPVETGTGRVSAGRIEQTLGYNARPPYAGDYRLRVTIASASQPDALLEFIASHPAPAEGWFCDFAVGTAAELKAQKAAVQKEVEADLTRIHSSWRDLTFRFKTWWPLEAPDLAAWESWEKSWNEDLSAVEKRNGERLDAEIYWVESGGKRYIRYLLRELRVMLRDFRAAIAQKPEAREPYQGYLDHATSFEALLNRYLQNLGFGSMMDRSKVEPACDGLAAALAGAIGQVSRLAEGSSAADRAAALAAHQAAALGHLFTLSREANEYGYAALMDLAALVPSAFSACESALAPGAPAGAPDAARAACDRAARVLSDLRTALGLPPR